MSEPTTAATSTRCNRSAPIVKFDTAPILCEREAGHDGDHSGRSYEDQDRGAVRTWNQDGYVHAR